MKIPPSTLKKMALVAGGIAVIGAAQWVGEHVGERIVEGSLSEFPATPGNTPGTVTVRPTPAVPAPAFLGLFPLATPTPAGCPGCGMG